VARLISLPPQVAANIEACNAPRDITSIERAFLQGAAELEFVFAGIMSHLDPIKPSANAIRLSKFPKAWLQLYSEAGYPKLRPHSHPRGSA
jgi:hypothetical protein